MYHATKGGKTLMYRSEKTKRSFPLGQTFGNLTPNTGAPSRDGG